MILENLQCPAVIQQLIDKNNKPLKNPKQNKKETRHIPDHFLPEQFTRVTEFVTFGRHVTPA